jgi:hypothetical protein
MKNFCLIVYSVVLLSACNPWQNSEDAERKDQIEVNGYYYTYYVQSMWDAELEFIVKTEYKPSNSIKSPNGELHIDSESVVYKNANSSRNYEVRKFKIENGVVEICTKYQCEAFEQ